jgi:hypothetical protein
MKDGFASDRDVKSVKQQLQTRFKVADKILEHSQAVKFSVFAEKS